ncbi:GNAT family N-acetyltransferase [Paenibacillus tuaregi]|uniref:GNAT family N-acetyltransferase n=1 Tax=Paenibacillus tuaregi TaxID=1816681 RepID=UPI000838A3F1|nr:GNAT family N-acetyltransferase [Paenibacillus tuaregi]
MEIRRLSACTLEEAVQAWNDGFEGYYFNATTTPEAFIKRMTMEELSPTLSVVAFKDNRPVGIVLSGVRDSGGRRIAWNGGTGVAMPLRGSGNGRTLMEASIAALKEEGVELSTLEAISENAKAIALYEKLGYKIVDQLEHLNLKGAAPANPLPAGIQGYTAKRVAPVQAGQLPFYRADYTWQTQWQNAKDGEAVIIHDESGTPAGYAYFRKTYSPAGIHTATTLFQCEAAPGHSQAEGIIRLMLAYVFGDFNDDINRIVPNVPLTASALTYSVLREAGFTTMAAQVQMVKEL